MTTSPVRSHRLDDPAQRQRTPVGNTNRSEKRPRPCVEVHQLGDPMVEQPPTWAQQLGERAHVEVDALLPTCSTMPMLEIASNCPAGELPVVGDPELDLVLKTRLAHALATELDLLLGQGDPEDVDAVVRRRVDGEAAPSAADVEDPLAVLEIELGADEVELGLLARPGASGRRP